MIGSQKPWAAAGGFSIAPALRNSLVVVLVVALACADTLVGFAKDAQVLDPAVVAAQVKKFGVGKSVKVKLIGGEKLNGHIQSIGPESFTITVSKVGGERAIPYNQVVEVKDPGPIFWMLVGAALVVIIIVAIKR